MTVVTIPKRIRAWAEELPDQASLREKANGVWQDITWREYWGNAELVGHGLLAHGIVPGDRIGIHSENRPEWLFVDVGAVAVRAVTVGFYPTNPAAEVAYLLKDSGTRILFAEDQEQVDKAMEVIDDLDSLELIVYFEERGVRDYEHPKLLSWTDFLEAGRAHLAQDRDAVDRLVDHAEPADVVTLIYTSGTTGPPKGAMLTARNVEFATEVALGDGGLYSPPASPDDVVLSYLPLCHVLERAITVWLNATSGALVHFAESIETIQSDLREVQPTLFFAVPRIWEKLAAGIHIRLASASRLKRANATFWLKQAAKVGEERIANGGDHTARTRLVMAVGYPFLYRSLRDRIGLRKARAAGSGAAPISPEILAFFYGIGVEVREAYGMTENAAVATSNRPGRMKLGTVGEPYPNIDFKLDETTGEILTRHPAVFAGYWNKPDKTAETIDADGWLHTGDVGEWVDGTHVRIIDRIKDIIITAGGKNISPSEIENSLKASPFIKEAVVVGDKRAYLTALVGIELDTVGDWAQRQKMSFTTYRDLSEKPEVLALVQGIVAETNDKFARVEHVRKFRMIPKELDHEDGELTATQKVKRSSMHKMFEHLIDDMYDNATGFAGGDLKAVHGTTKEAANG